jgi:glucose/arabinose dehydrogenase
MTTKRILLFCGLISILMCGRAFGQASNVIRLQPFLTGLSLPLYITNAKDGTNRLYVVQQRGLIRVVQPGSSTPTDFLNVAGVVSSSGNERGLLGLAFHPQYATNRRFFIYYTRQSDGAIEIAEYERSVGNPNQANPTAVRVIITIPHPNFSNHNGGTILFGPDGYLYAGTGDGGSGNDPAGNAQNINALLGKILRIDINTPVGQVPAYNIPPTNPFAGATPGADEIYAVGMRNPYRFSFDRGGTNQLWAGDVGQDAIEEVDIITLGGNYGWRVYEGTQCTNIEPGNCIPGNYIPPVFQYANAGARCSVTGGNIYRGTLKTFSDGTYVHADYCSGEIFTWFNNTHTMRLDTSRLASSFGEDERGEIYMTGLGSSATPNGTVDKIVRVRSSSDFDGDLRTDVSIYRPSDGLWYIANSASSNVRIQQFGLNGDIPVNEDVDGDLISDIGVYRPSTGAWYHYRSSDDTVSVVGFGLAGDIPAIADFDGDTMADIAVFRPSTGAWWIRRTTDPNNLFFAQFGVNGDVPVPGDYDGDGRYDIAVWRPSNGIWYTYLSASGNIGATNWGLNGDTPTQADFDGDGRTDLAVFRPSNGVWYIIRSQTGSVTYFPWGAANDLPVAGDYDGDGADDIAVFRPSNGVWYRVNSSNSAQVYTPFGLSGDLPAPRYDAP